MSRPWFDPETKVLKLDEYVLESPSFQKIMADDRVSEEELDEHRARVVSLLQELDGMLEHEERDTVEEALVELSVLYAIERYSDLPPRR